MEKLPQAITEFSKDSKSTLSEYKYVLNTVQSIRLGMDNETLHDIWIHGEDIEFYCLGRIEIDPDGEYVYTAYQLWINPKYRNLKLVKKIISFLRFYAQKQGLKRLYVVSSRMDKIAAYTRGLGKQFKEVRRTFMETF